MSLSNSNYKQQIQNSHKLYVHQHFQEALDCYTKIISELTNDTNAIDHLHLMGACQIAQSECLLALHKSDEAYEIICNPSLAQSVARFRDMKLFMDYFRVYGKILGWMGDLDQMEIKIKRAIDITIKHLHISDLTQVISTIFEPCLKLENWDYLNRYSNWGRQLAMQHSLDLLFVESQIYASYAQKGMENYQNALNLTKRVVNHFDTKKDAPEIFYWKSYIQDLESMIKGPQINKV